MTENTTYRRILRREQHRSRSQSTVVALVAAAAVAALTATEATFAALERPPLLVAPEAAVALVNEPTTPVLVGAAVAALLGLVAVVLALAPGRRGRHALAHDRLAIVVDDTVLASSLGRAARRVAGLPAGRVRTTVSARRATVAVTPSSGFPVDADAVKAAADELAARLSPTPRLRLAVAVAENGTVGA